MQGKTWFFGNFGTGNFGNEVTLQTMLHHLRARFPEAKVACICTEPNVLSAKQQIHAVPISRTIVKPWQLRSRFGKWLRRIFVGVPCELYRWWEAFRTLKTSDRLIVLGTGLLTDAYGNSGWGPYGVLKWSVAAKLRGCKILFVSVGAGPIGSVLGKYCAKAALTLAEFRTYRDEASMDHLKSIGLKTNGDCVYPDLAFSLPEISVPRCDNRCLDRPAVGLGVMTDVGMYGAGKPSTEKYQHYVDSLMACGSWLVEHGYGIRLLIGDVHDTSLSQQFGSRLKASCGPSNQAHIVDELAGSVEELIPQIIATEIVIATRFHNVLLALVLKKPVIAISFHHKSTSLMHDMGLAEYCHDINNLDASKLIEQFQAMEKNLETLKAAIGLKVAQSRGALDKQYELVFKAHE
jgi:polysaccharide pyruvyl transferase WcaK-like protein